MKLILVYCALICSAYVVLCSAIAATYVIGAWLARPVRRPKRKKKK